MVVVYNRDIRKAIENEEKMNEDKLTDKDRMSEIINKWGEKHGA